VRPWLAAVASYVRAGQEGGRHHADVDAEAYVVHMLQLVLTATAAAPVVSVVIPGDARARYDRELSRIARASLFLNSGDEAAPARRTKKAKR
jgi:hypothetical protein